MKRITILCVLALNFLFFSCEEYLDKTIETDLTIEEVFKNYENSQGFVEEMYAMVVDYSTAAHWQHYMCYGEDAIGRETWMFDYFVDIGDYWKWENDGGSMFSNPDFDTNKDIPMDRNGVWQCSWAGIRKANIVLTRAEELMVDATQQEKDAVMGQAYFFRAFFHQEIMKFWGPMPYIDVVLTDDWKLARPKLWADTAVKLAEDFQRAADLLPQDWDDSMWGPGQKTLGSNMFRVTKGAAYAFKGKTLLYAASPLMQNSNNTYFYDKELCSQAVDAFAEVLKLDRYALTDWDNYSNVFYTMQGGKYPTSSEFIFSQSGSAGWFGGYLPSNWQLGALDGANATSSPTHNYIHNYFGMIDGMACDDSPIYNPADPWTNRDPRFYKWVIIDGDQMVETLGAAGGENAIHRYAQFQKGGAHRSPASSAGTRTGYMAKKWFPLSHNNFDNRKCFAWRVHMRLTDVYLMYAEAALNAYGINGKPASYDLSAVGAINAIRERAVPDGSLNVKSHYLSSDELFMDEIRRERAVEMAWEAHRWMDVRRWKLGKDLKYREKTEILFDRNAAGKPINLVENVILTKVFEDKHYWLPLPKDDVELYEGFPQNPGW